MSIRNVSHSRSIRRHCDGANSRKNRHLESPQWRRRRWFEEPHGHTCGRAKYYGCREPKRAPHPRGIPDENWLFFSEFDEVIDFPGSIADVSQAACRIFFETTL